jgi:type I restriction enzyme S subunit
MMPAAVPQGYKQTEVGVIPADWIASTIGENSKWMSGGTPRRNNAEFWRGTIPWISGSTLKSVQISTSDQFLTSEAVSAGSKMAPIESTLLLVRGSALHSEIRAGLVVLPVSFNQDVKALVPNVSVEPKFLTYYILGYSEELLKLVSSAGNSAGVLDTKLVQNFKFLKPPLPEQRAIATALSDVDALFTAQDKLIAKKRDIKQAAMQQLLTGKQRLPGFSGEWEVKRIGDIFIVTAGGDFDESRSSSFQDNRYPFPVYSNAISSLGLYGYCDYADHAAGSITVTARGLVGVANFRNHKFTAIGRVIVLQPKEVGDGRFFAEYINKRITFALETTGVPQLTAPQISGYNLPVPPLPEQTAIATVLSEMDADITARERQRDKTLALKQGMMQELLTGRIRLV